jgi:hypothetical protein
MTEANELIRAEQFGMPRPLGYHGLLRMVAFSCLVLFAAGCASDYDRRVDALTDLYERGQLSPQDYRRFVYDAKEWYK